MIPNGDAVAGIVSSLNEFRVDPELIDRVVKSLEDGRDLVPGQINPVSETAFGTLPRGVQLGWHTTNARTFMLETYQGLDHLLASYVSDIVQFQNESIGIDEDSSAQMRGVTAAIESNNRSRGISGGGER